MQKFTSVEELSRDAITQNRLVGFEKIARPKKDSPSEDWDRFFNDMGRPESADKYDLSEFKPPENVQWDNDLQQSMLEDFHKAGLSQQQAKEVIEAYAERQATATRDHTESLQQARTATESVLREKWGRAFEPNKAVAADEFTRVFGDNAEMVMNIALPSGQLFGNEPAMIEAFFNLGKKHQEHGMIGEKSVSEPSLSPADALMKAHEMETDPDNLAAITAGKPNNPIFKRWSMLMDFAHPEESR